MEDQAQQPKSDVEKGATDPRPLVLRSEDLFKSSREVWIEHGEVMYRLRLTSSGKLILTK